MDKSETSLIKSNALIKQVVQKNLDEIIQSKLSEGSAWCVACGASSSTLTDPNELKSFATINWEEKFSFIKSRNSFKTMISEIIKEKGEENWCVACGASGRPTTGKINTSLNIELIDKMSEELINIIRKEQLQPNRPQRTVTSAKKHISE